MRLAKGNVVRGEPRHGPSAFGVSPAARAVHANSMDLVEIGHRTIPLGDIANLCDGCDIAIHRIGRLEADELRPPRIGAHQAALKVDGAVVAKNLVWCAALPDTLALDWHGGSHPPAAREPVTGRCWTRHAP